MFSIFLFVGLAVDVVLSFIPLSLRFTFGVCVVHAMELEYVCHRHAMMPFRQIGARPVRFHQYVCVLY